MDSEELAQNSFRFDEAKRLCASMFHGLLDLTPEQKHDGIMYLHYILSCSPTLLRAQADNMAKFAESLESGAGNE